MEWSVSAVDLEDRRVGRSGVLDQHGGNLTPPRVFRTHVDRRRGWVVLILGLLWWRRLLAAPVKGRPTLLVFYVDLDGFAFVQDGPDGIRVTVAGGPVQGKTAAAVLTVNLKIKQSLS